MANQARVPALGLDAELCFNKVWITRTIILFEKSSSLSLHPLFSHREATAFQKPSG